MPPSLTSLAFLHLMLLTSIISTVNASNPNITSSLIYPDYETHPLYSNIPTSPSSSSSYEAFNAARMEGLKSTKSCYLNPSHAKGLGRKGYETVSFTTNSESAALFGNIQRVLEPIVESIRSTRPHASLSETLVNVDDKSLPPQSLAVYQSSIVDLLRANPGVVELIQASLNSAEFSLGVSMVHATDSSDFDLYMRGLPSDSNPSRLNNAHVDVGTCGALKAIIYLSDVNNVADGPFSIVPDSAKIMLDDPSGDPSSHSLLETMRLVRQAGGDWADEESRTNFITKVPPQHRHKSAVGLDHSSDSPFLKVRRCAVGLC